MSKCIVRGCNNKKSQGEFMGDICNPCYSMITTGEIKPSENFIYELWHQADPLNRCKLQKAIEDFEIHSQRVKEGKGKCGVCKHPYGDYICVDCADKLWGR